MKGEDEQMTDYISACIDRLVSYGLDCGLIQPEDAVYARNSLLAELGIQAYNVTDTPEYTDNKAPLEAILAALADFAVDSGLIGGFPSEHGRFETALMGRLTPRPSEVITVFRERYAVNPESATEYFYKLCQDSNYISRYKTARDIKWYTQTGYGQFEITVNLSKPEKDPRDIAQAGAIESGGYPACLLCVENEGYAGKPGHPARHNHRIIPVCIAGEQWGFQYSPYVYYNEHCIVLNERHVPMVIDKTAFKKLISFVEQFPHYFVGSNADLPIVGGSILAHEHFQGGRHSFPMETAPVEHRFVIRGYGDVKAGIVKWPLSVIRIASETTGRLVDCASHILDKWRSYTDESAFVFAYTDGTPHNSITPIARMRGGSYELDLVLRNNITTEEHPYGVFHPHTELHNIKKENIGLIEVMGLAVLPSRLKTEMGILRDAVLSGSSLGDCLETAKHVPWYHSWRERYGVLTADNIDGILQIEIGRSFTTALEHCAVFKNGAEGQAAFASFIESLGC